MTEQRKKELSFNLRVIQRTSALTHCVTVNPEQVSHDVMNSLRAESISSLFLIFILVPGKVFWSWKFLSEYFLLGWNPVVFLLSEEQEWGFFVLSHSFNIDDHISSWSLLICCGLFAVEWSSIRIERYVPEIQKELFQREPRPSLNSWNSFSISLCVYAASSLQGKQFESKGESHLYL